MNNWDTNFLLTQFIVGKGKKRLILAQFYMQLENYHLPSNQNSPHHQFNMQLGGLPPIGESEDDNSSNWNQLEDYHQSTNGRAPHQQLGSIGPIAFTHLLYMLMNGYGFQNVAIRVEYNLSSSIEIQSLA